MRRFAVVVLTLAAGAAFAPPADSAGPDLAYGCSPPTPPTPASCAAWHNTPVTLVWDWNSLEASPSAGNCNTQVFTHDVASLGVYCEVKQLGGSLTTGDTAYLHIDETPPAITGITPSRPPDANGWWNHLVNVAFAGTDATSGIAGCDIVPFSGPGTQVLGGCRDKAGNYATGTFSLNYDATPPTLSVKATPSSRSTTISWTTSPDVTLVQVRRAVGNRSARSKMVYSGRGKKFTDSGIRNGTTYRYTVKAFDQAGNATAKTARSTPRLSLGLRPRKGTRFAHPPRLTWPGIRGADYYNVQLFRNGVKVLTAWPAGAHLKLHRHWSFGGRRFRLSPGRYRWYVWPGYGSRAAHRYGAFIGQSRFVIVRR